MIPVCLWFLTKNKKDSKRRDRRKQTLFVDARKLGTLIDQLTDADIARIVGTFHAWRGDPPPRHSGEGRNPATYEDIAGFCKSASTAEIATHGHVLTPGRYVGAEELEEDDELFEEKMAASWPNSMDNFENPRSWRRPSVTT